VGIMAQGTKGALVKCGQRADEYRHRHKMDRGFLNSNIPQEVIHPDRRTEAEWQLLMADTEVKFAHFMVNIGRGATSLASKLQPNWDQLQSCPFWATDGRNEEHLQMVFNAHKQRLRKPIREVELTETTDDRDCDILTFHQNPIKQGIEYDQVALVATQSTSTTTMPRAIMERDYMALFVDLPKGMLNKCVLFVYTLAPRRALDPTPRRALRCNDTPPCTPVMTIFRLFLSVQGLTWLQEWKW
jgi:hypothetical protein